MLSKQARAWCGAGARVRAYLKARFRCLVPILCGCGAKQRLGAVRVHGAGLSKQR